MGYWGWKPYVSVAERRRKAVAAASRAKKAGAALSPVAATRGAIARTFWGKAWCDNLERYSDYANRLPRGRSYLRAGSVIDLAIEPGRVRARVVGSRLYQVEVRVAAVAAKRWKAIGADCAGSIDSMVELLRGTFSTAVMQRLCRPGDGLFPVPKEIAFTCSCPDWASMCKHVAAVLYGVGARLDERPQLLFDLRRVDGQDLLAQAGAGLARPRKAPPKARVLAESALAEVFGIDMAEPTAPEKPARPAARQGKQPAAGAVDDSSNNATERREKRASASSAKARGRTVNQAAVSAAATSKKPAGRPGGRKSSAAPAKTRRKG